MSALGGKRTLTGQAQASSFLSMEMRRWSRVAVAVFAASLAQATIAAPTSTQVVPSNLGYKTRFVLLVRGGGLGVGVDNRFVFSSKGPAHSELWFVELNASRDDWCGRREKGTCTQTHTTAHDVIDGKTCPAVASILDELVNVRAAETGSTTPPVADAPLTTLITYRPPDYRKETEELSEWIGPLVDWWTRSEEKLASCLARTGAAHN
jgi:hypothetical protein